METPAKDTQPHAAIESELAALRAEALHYARVSLHLPTPLQPPSAAESRANERCGGALSARSRGDALR